MQKSVGALFGFRRVHKNLLGGCGRSVFQALKFFTGLKADGLARRNADFFPSAGISANAGFARLDAENTELAEFDALAAAKSTLERFEDGFDGLFRLRAADVGFGNHSIYDVKLDHTTLQESVGRC